MNEATISRLLYPADEALKARLMPLDQVIGLMLDDAGIGHVCGWRIEGDQLKLTSFTNAIFEMPANDLNGLTDDELVTRVREAVRRGVGTR